VLKTNDQTSLCEAVPNIHEPNSTTAPQFPQNRRMSESPGFFTEHRSRMLIAIALTVSCLAVYSQVIGFDFINIDDRPFVYENQMVLSGLNSKSIWWAITAFHAGNWNPVTWISHMLDVTLFGSAAGPMHAMNVVFHTINSILVFFVFGRFTSKTWHSAAMAFLFALHPVHVESVAWIAERRDVLSTMFWLLTMLAYFKYVERLKEPSKDAGILGHPTFWSILTFVFLALGLMSKAMPVTLPFVLLLCDYWSLERLNKFSDLWPLVKEKLPLFVLTICSCVITFLAQSSAGATVSLQTSSYGDRLLNVIISYAKYIIMMFYPTNLGIMYPFDNKFEPVEVIASVALLLVISVLCWQQRAKRRYLIMGWLWFLGTFVPVIGLVQIGMQSHADRYTYVPYFGLFIMLVWGIGDLVNRFEINKIAVTTVSIAVIATLGGLTVAQVSRWRSSETLYTHTLSFTTNNYFVMSNLCLYYINKSDKNTAEQRCTELLEATPPSAEAFSILGLLRTDVGKYDDAVNYFEKGIRMNPNWAILYLNYSLALSKLDRTEDAEKALLKAKSMNDGSVGRLAAAKACNEFAKAVEKKGQKEKAKDFYSQAAQLDPDLAEAAAGLKRLSTGN